MTAPFVPLYPYQQQYLADPSVQKASLWCRSSGKTFSVMLEPVLDCQFADVEKRAVQWFVFSSGESMTEEMMVYARRHAEAIGVACEHASETFELPDRKITMSRIEFEHGSRIVALPTNALTIRGRHGNLIWGEAGKTPNDEAIWAAASPIASRTGFRVRLEGTPGGKRGPFYEIMSGKRAGWSLHVVDIHRAIADGAPLSVEKAQSMVGSGRAYLTEYLCQFEDAESRLIPLERIMQCEDSSALVVPLLRIDGDKRSDWTPYLLRSETERAPSEGYDSVEAWRPLFAPLKGRNCFVGYDVARKGHLSVLWVIEPDGLLRRTRAVVAFKGRRFAEQRAALWAALEHATRGCIDATGIGLQFAEEAVEKFGQRVEPVMFTAAVPGDIAERVARGFEDWIMRIPAAREVRESIHSVYKVTTAANHVRYDATATEEAGHADYFWALGLAQLACGDGAMAMPHIESWGRPTWSRGGVL